MRHRCIGAHDIVYRIIAANDATRKPCSPGKIARENALHGLKLSGFANANRWAEFAHSRVLEARNTVDQEPGQLMATPPTLLCGLGHLLRISSVHPADVHRVAEDSVAVEATHQVELGKIGMQPVLSDATRSIRSKIGISVDEDLLPRSPQHREG